MSRNKPDVICIADDLCDTSLSKDKLIQNFLKEYVYIAPTYFSLGNHDYLIDKNDLEGMRQIGIVVLNDTYVRFNKEILIGGMTSYFYHKCEKYDPRIHMELFPEVDWLDSFEKEEGYKILIDHHPDNYEKYTSYRNIQLILSGYAHGGQIRLFGKGIYARSQGFFPKYDGGIYDEKLVVSRGMTNTLPIPRLWNPTELVIIELEGRCKNVV